MATLIATLPALGACGGDDPEPRDTGTEAPVPGPPARQPPREPPPIGDGQGGVELTEVGSFEQPLYVAQPRGDDALYVVEQTGRVQRLPADGGEPELFLDLSGEVSCCGEQGLLSVAFAPDYERSGLVYASYTNTDGDSRIVEFRRSEEGPVADPESAREVLAIDQPYPNHNGGLVLFGPDGHLYAGYGDGGAGGDPERRAQDLSTLLGKLLRIDPRASGGAPYSIPPGNPFRGTEGARPEILALGLRNPWRFSFDREFLWIADVGQSEQEEVNGPISGLAEGANFGWSAFEGTERFNADQTAPGHLRPTLVYGRDRGCSVTGGYVVRDTALESLYGRYLYGDYCEGELRSFVPNPGGDASDDQAIGLEVAGLSSFGEDRSGHIYATSIEGPVYRLDPRP